MAISPSRLAAFDILLRVETQDAYSAELLHSERVDALSSADRGLCMELVMGVLRWRSRLDTDIASRSFTPFRKLDLEVLTALRLGVYQLEFLGRVPARAAINDSVELVKRSRKASAAGLANAVLRKIPKTTNEERAARHSASELSPAESSPVASDTELARDFAHPQWLVSRWIANYGGVRAASICRFDQQVPTATLRLSRSAAVVEAELRESGVELGPGALLASARRVLHGDPSHTRACAEGRAVIQDEGSQLIAALVGHGKRMLDCCAAPGGKTAALADYNPQAQIIAVDLHAHRARLMRRLVRAPNVRIIAADARALPVSGLFNRVLVDVPCSGTGTLARNPEIKWRLQPEALADLHARQVALLRAALSHLAPGGRLVYSTCSLEPEENEAVVEEVLLSAATRDAVGTNAPSLVQVHLIDVHDELSRLKRDGEISWPDIDSLTSGPYLRTIPGTQPCDGFFAAVLERT